MSGEIFLEMKPEDISGQLSYARDNGIRYFTICWHRHQRGELRDLSFLDPEEVKGMLLHFEWLEDQSELNRFRNMDIFSAGYSSRPAAIIDLANFPRLRALSLYWNNYYRSLDTLKNLLHLDLWYYKPQSRDLRDFIRFDQLANLTLVMATVDSLDGMEQLSALKEMKIANNRALKRFFSRPELSRLEVVDLWIESCKKMELETLPRMESLKQLRLISMGKIPSLKNILPRFPNLESLNLTDSELINGDIHYLLDFPSIKHIRIDNKKHYSLKEKDINQLLKERNAIRGIL